MRTAALIFVNLVDFDQQYGHRNDIEGYGAALEQFDAWVPELESRLGEGDLAIFTADHGCDPTTPSTDHSREYVPLLVTGPKVRAGVNLGVRGTLSDIGQTVAENFGARLAQGRKLFTTNLMRTPVMSGNWKMYKTPAETTAFFEKFRPLVEKSSHCEIVICPPFTNLAAAVDAVKGSNIRDRRAEYRLGQGRRLHRRDLRSYDRRRGRHPHHHRPQRTPPVFQRDR